MHVLDLTPVCVQKALTWGVFSFSSVSSAFFLSPDFFPLVLDMSKDLSPSKQTFNCAWILPLVQVHFQLHRKSCLCSQLDVSKNIYSLSQIYILHLHLNTLTCFFCLSETVLSKVTKWVLELYIEYIYILISFHNFVPLSMSSLLQYSFYWKFLQLLQLFLLFTERLLPNFSSGDGKH